MHKFAACAAAVASLLLCSCAATATLPEAAAETMATPESATMGLILPQDNTSDQLWLAAAALQAMLQATPETAFSLPSTVQLEVEPVLQNPELPNGCEITSATIVLHYLGYDIDKVTLADEYLPKHIPFWEADPTVEFMGNPADELSYYCYPSAVTTAVNAYLDEQGSSYHALDITGAEPAELEMYLAQGEPVLIWATRAFTAPMYSEYFTLPDGSWPYANLHCLVLTGYDGDNYYFADPMQEITEIDRDTFALRYEQMGSHAVVITK